MPTYKDAMITNTGFMVKLGGGIAAGILLADVLKNNVTDPMSREYEHGEIGGSWLALLGVVVVVLLLLAIISWLDSGTKKKTVAEVVAEATDQ